MVRTKVSKTTVSTSFQRLAVKSALTCSSLQVRDQACYFWTTAVGKMLAHLFSLLVPPLFLLFLVVTIILLLKTSVEPGNENIHRLFYLLYPLDFEHKTIGIQ